MARILWFWPKVSIEKIWSCRYSNTKGKKQVFIADDTIDSDDNESVSMTTSALLWEATIHKIKPIIESHSTIVYLDFVKMLKKWQKFYTTLLVITHCVQTIKDFCVLGIRRGNKDIYNSCSTASNEYYVHTFWQYLMKKTLVGGVEQ